MPDRNFIKSAVKASVPVYFGYLPTSFVFGIMMSAAGYHPVVAVAMSVFIYAGAGQYLAVGLLTENAGFATAAILTFLINSKHLFYGISMLKDYENAGWRKPYLVFSLTDEAYAILTEPGAKRLEPRDIYCFIVSASIHFMWIFGTLLGALFGAAVSFNASGLEFTLTALFIVILIEQLKAYKTKLPFVIGFGSSLFALPLAGRSNMLLISCLLSGIAIVLLRKEIERRDAR